jgi:signal transduction histidine kinase
LTQGGVPMSEAKILVIDDAPDVREACAQVLAPHGLTVEAASCSEGPRKIESGGYDLVLLDLGSADLIAPIHAHDPEAVCIVLAHRDAAEQAAQLVQQGAFYFVVKPFTAAELWAAAGRGLERRWLSLQVKRLQAVEAEAQRLAQDKARLEEIDKSKMTFIRLVTHELQAPVAAIQNYMQLILDGYVPPEKQRATIEKCMARADEQMAMIADLLELGKLQAVGQPSQPTLVRLDEALRKALEPLQLQADHKRIRLELDVAGEVLTVRGSPDQFKSVWTNLIGNAIKYTPSGGSVEISLRGGKGRVVGEVRDTGIGIPREAQGRLFTEFFRAENAKAQNIRGTGLGLAIVKQIIQGAGGQILVESEVGRGSVFTFVLPAVESPPG